MPTLIRFRNMMISSLQIFNKQVLNAKFAFDLYYCRTSYVLYRFKSRIKREKIPFPPSVFGDEDVHTVLKDATNQKIKNTLKVKTHPESQHFPDEYALSGPPKGRVYATVPFKFQVEKGKTYMWCSCGYSNNQPFCDSTHKIYWSTNLTKKVPKHRPIKYVATETKDVWFCNCKQSEDRPLCDGTHKSNLVKKS